MQPYGTSREQNPQDRKRRYLSRRMSHEDLPDASWEELIDEAARRGVAPLEVNS